MTWGPGPLEDYETRVKDRIERSRELRSSGLGSDPLSVAIALAWAMVKLLFKILSLPFRLIRRG